MITLAFLTAIITGGPSSMIGLELVTIEPVECDLRSWLAEFEENGLEADLFCEYTGAPATSIRPEARP